MKFKIWNKLNKRWLTSNCGIFLLDQNGTLWFKEELLNSDGHLENVKNVIDYEIVWE